MYIRLNMVSCSVSITYFRSTVIVFSGGCKKKLSSSLLTSVSTWFVVVGFETGEGSLWEIIASLQLLVLSICCNNAECGGTTNVVFGGGYGQLIRVCF